MSTPDTNEIQPATDVAAMLARIGAVGIGADDEFTFASGLHSPIYCDNRLFLSHPAERRAAVRQLARLIEQTAGTDWDAVAGVASAGIPWAAWLAHEFDKPMVYIRQAEKEHGTRRRIEGGLETGKEAILVEDLITTGGSALSAVSALREEGLKCDYCFSIVDYGFTVAARRFEAERVAHETLTDTEGLITALKAHGSAS